LASDGGHDSSPDTLTPDALSDSVAPDASVDSLAPDTSIDSAVDAATDSTPPDQNVDLPPLDLPLDTVQDTTFDLPADSLTPDGTPDGTIDSAPDGTIDSGPPSFGPVGIPISTHTGAQRAPVGAFDGTNFLLVWEDSRNTNNEIYGARVSPAGAVLDLQGLAIGNSASDLFAPAIAFDGTNYQIAFAKLGGIYGTRITTGGGVLDPGGFTVGENISMTSGYENESPSIACLTAQCFGAWTDRRSAAWPVEDIYGARYQKDGTLLDSTGVAVNTASDFQINPFALTDGVDFFVVWQTHVLGSNDIYFNRISPTP
jgi:hypothetical protein